MNAWKRVEDEMPDSDLTVMIYHAEEDEPVWLGYHDGDTWRTVDGAQCLVSHWMDLPAGPGENTEVTDRHGGGSVR